VIGSLCHLWNVARREAAFVGARSARADGTLRTALPFSGGGIAAIHSAWHVDGAWHVGSNSVVHEVMGARGAIRLAGGGQAVRAHAVAAPDVAANPLTV